MTNILFVCSGNSVRSQMAEGLARHLGNGDCEIKSAGITPIGVHSAAAKSMNEIGIDISAHTSDHLSRDLLDWADYVVTLCNSVMIAFPVLPPRTKHIHWDIPNPDRYYDSPELQLKGFARVRDLLKEKIEKLFEEI
ncbi:MAG: arsenate reductase [candidate division Zixibacteria bacterium HGW-Zixibacteria-1]|nr:MAG: arsenate reductase [candidate division Zixibacteria bacterium HGW-Zixibacteria-1]